MDQFFQYGATFLYRFAISLMRTLGDKILSTNDPVKLFGYLRLDPKFVDVDFAEIIKGADDFNVETGIWILFLAIREWENKSKLEKTI